MQPAVDGQDKSAVRFLVGNFSDAAGSRPTRIRTTDFPVCGRLCYHSTVVCSDSPDPPHCMKPSLLLKKKPKLTACLTK